MHIRKMPTQYVRCRGQGLQNLHLARGSCHSSLTCPMSSKSFIHSRKAFSRGGGCQGDLTAPDSLFLFFRVLVSKDECMRYFARPEVLLLWDLRLLTEAVGRCRTAAVSKRDS